jgi:hypothetical protein
VPLVISLHKAHVPGHYRTLPTGRRVYIEPYFTKVVPKHVDRPGRTRRTVEEPLPAGRAKVSAESLAHRLVRHVHEERLTHEQAQAQLTHYEARAHAGHGLEHGGGHRWTPEEVHGFVQQARAGLEAHRAWRAQQPPKETRPRKRPRQPAVKQPPAVPKPEPMGNVSRVITPTNGVAKELGRRDIETRFVVKEAAALIHSLDPRYPPALQPRLERLPGKIDPATEATVTRLVHDPDFESLTESRQASLGAPLIDSNGHSISGTARIEGLKRLYQGGSTHAADYKQFLQDEAERLGLDPATIQGMRQPVLVRVITSPLSHEQLVAFAEEANQRETQAPGVISTAMADARKLTPDILSLLETDEEGVVDVLATRNAAFRHAVLAQVIPPAEHGAVVANQQWTTDGAARLRRAIFARAYGNTPALERLGSSEQAERRNLGNALLSAAPAFSRLQAAIEGGAAYDRPLAGDLVQSVNTLVSLSQQGTSVQHWLDQMALFDQGMSPLAKDLVMLLDTPRLKRSAKMTTALFHSYVEGVYALGDPRQAALFGTAQAPSAAAILAQAVTRVEDGDAATQTTLFGRQAA